MASAARATAALTAALTGNGDVPPPAATRDDTTAVAAAPAAAAPATAADADAKGEAMRSKLTIEQQRVSWRVTFE
jgi:hypothetical protein